MKVRILVEKKMFRLGFLLGFLVILLFGNCKKEKTFNEFTYDETYQPKQWDKLSIVDYYCLLPYLRSASGSHDCEYKKAFLTAPPKNLLDGQGAEWQVSLLSESSGAIFLYQAGGGGGETERKEYVMWKRKSDTDLVGVNAIYCSLAGCRSDLTFLTFKDKKWYDITKEVFPGINEQTGEYLKSLKHAKNEEDYVALASDTYAGIRCHLPVIGKDIECAFDLEGEGYTFEDNPKIKYAFKDNKFVLEKKL
ncbi:hypothetical protein J9305_02620 [Leptospira interrogans]|uniref:hypothetical protein n=1 Tax=Leptospira interrogans TaxID=173 RepID=UPI000278379C|nr:hypothetical protein [Leptospira interrogans]EJP02297.1 hypothetical protein LEP1GSC007_0845 [Leptospira interrogans serovar Bulgarica str. Mallika]EKO88133.1 hypothetical protein LEP1GSC009_3455 [Leptospira interrogans serovar Grippotyphosa str. Andaman]UID83912.1 hypothetical protein J9305_02620 [Leptospira interrogans]